MRMKLPLGEILTVLVIVALGLANLALYTGVLDGFDPVHAGRVPTLPSGNAPSDASTPEEAALDNSSERPGVYVPSQGIRHTEAWPLDERVEFCEGDVSDDCYASNPPSSGLHLPVTQDLELPSGDVVDVPPDPGIYSFEIPREAIPHIEEHAGVFVGYHCASDACEQIAEDLALVVEGLLDEGKRVVMAPDSDLAEDTIGLASWTRVDVMSLAEYSRQRVSDFVEAHSCRYDPERFCD